MSDVSKTNEALIDRARFLAYGLHSSGDSADANLVNRLADALEAKTGIWVDMSSAVGVETQLAATRVPVQGEPNDDRELREILADAIGKGYNGMAFRFAVPGHESRPKREWLLDAADNVIAEFPMLSRAAVPDAATELVPESLVEAVVAERDAALAAVESVKRLLAPMRDRLSEYGEVPLRHAVSKTLELLAALDGAPEPEWEWGCRSSSHTPLNANVRTFYFLEDAQSHARDCQSPAIVRRRKAGPWEVCNE